MFVSPLNLNEIAPFVLVPTSKWAVVTIKFIGDLEKMVRRQHVFYNLEATDDTLNFNVDSIHSVLSIMNLFRDNGSLRKIMGICDVSIESVTIKTLEGEVLSLEQLKETFRGYYCPELTRKHDMMFGPSKRKVGSLALLRSVYR